MRGPDRNRRRRNQAMASEHTTKTVSTAGDRTGLSRARERDACAGPIEIEGGGIKPWQVNTRPRPSRPPVIETGYPGPESVTHARARSKSKEEESSHGK